MEEERKLLQESKGCFKCQTPYVGHHVDKCTVTISRENYHTLTAQDVLLCKKHKGETTNKGPLAAITDGNLTEQVSTSRLPSFQSFRTPRQAFLTYQEAVCPQ